MAQVCSVIPQACAVWPKLQADIKGDRIGGKIRPVQLQTGEGPGADRRIGQGFLRFLLLRAAGTEGKEQDKGQEQREQFFHGNEASRFGMPP